MTKWNMIVDVAKCENCRNCFLAVKDEHVGNDFPRYAAPQPLHGHQWIDIRRRERGEYPMVDAHYLPVMCNQCDDAPCIAAGRNDAVYKRPDGIVIIDPEKAKGQKEVVHSCPYGEIFWNEDLKLPQKWIFDAHLLDKGWTQTRAEQACPTGALKSVKCSDEQMAELAKAQSLVVLLPEAKTRPRVYYKNYHLYGKCFLGGTVVTRRDGREDCVAGARVGLNRQGATIASTETDVFGEFRFDGLDLDSGRYDVTVEAAGRTARATAELGQSAYIGVIQI
ncbi:4Fe-4S dicluster domain-containing protein [Roseiarcus sp.]|uniref:4Fe-4S dicluster domain-containing protein n=1 Tax=Roseiarcus sp. TaxID=1969460 RepID=UPI003F9A9400